MNDRQGAYLELTIIKIQFKNQLDTYKKEARRNFKKITHYILQGNGEHAEAYSHQVKSIRAKAREIQKKIEEIQQLQRELRSA